MAYTEEEAIARLGGNRTYIVRSMFVQVIIDMFFCGIYTRMLWTYCNNMKGDSKRLKTLVASTAVLSYGITAFIIWWIADLFISNYGLYATFLESYVISWFPLLDGAVTGVVQGFFTYRVFALTGSWKLVLVLIALLFASFAGALATKIIWGSHPELSASSGFMAPMLVWLINIMVANIIITVAILHSLIKSGVYQSRHILFRIFHLTMLSQLICTLMATAFVIQYAAMPTSYVGATFLGIQSKLYSVGLMYTINSRNMAITTTQTQPHGIGTSNSNVNANIGLADLSGCTVRRSVPPDISLSMDVDVQKDEEEHPPSPRSMATAKRSSRSASSAAPLNVSVKNEV